MKIPKTIHQIWCGDKPKPENWMRTWKEKNPGWKYILWDEEMIRNLPLKNVDLFNYYKEKNRFHGMADVARIEIVLNEGGVYIDADIECLEPIDELMDCNFFAVETNTKGRITNSVIGAEKGHAILKEYVEKMGVADQVEPCWNTIGAPMFTQAINKLKTDKDIILPPYTFFPEDRLGTIKYKGKDKVFARHYWGTTKKLY